MNLSTFLKQYQFLPKPLRDFHEQKRLFKRIDEDVQRRIQQQAAGQTIYAGYTWMIAHTFVIDIFLWFMARHGWTLQRSRQPLEFHDLNETLRDFDERELAALKATFAAIQPTQPFTPITEQSNEPDATQ